MASNLEVTWIDHGREPKCEPNPDFPEGQDIDISFGRPSCSVDLPYPAERCGVFIVKCDVCGLSLGLTTAGRPDDPRTVTVPCLRKVH